MSLNVTQSIINNVLTITQENIKATLTVTQSVNEFNLQATQNLETTLLKPTILSYAGPSITRTSELINDGADGTSTYVEQDELGAVATSNDYNDLDNLPVVPAPITNTSELINDGADGVNPFITQNDVINNTNTSDLINDGSDGTSTYVEADEISNLIREEFTFSGSQTFTLSNNYGQVYSVEVQGQGALSTSQYTLVPTNQITINDTLDVGDYVVILYSNAIAGLQPYYSQAEVDVFLETKEDKIINYKFVSSLSDLPTPVSNIITLQDDKTYFITNTIDLLGNRLVGGSNTTILGASSENSILTSTGLGIGIPLLSSIYTTPIRNIAINDVDTAVNFDGSTNPNDIALDWNGLNFVNVPNIGLIKDASNFIYDKGAFLNSKGLKFDGTIGTIGFGNSLFSGDGLAGNIIDLLSTLTVTRRFRIIYSSVVAFGSTIGINVDASASIPVESYILDTINFSGGSTYLSGVTTTDNKTNFLNCVGIQNTAEVSQYYMNGNATTTTIASAGVAVKALGTTTSSAVTQKFTNTDNRATYVGSLTRTFKVSATLSVESGNNNQIGVYIAKNGVLLTESEVYGTTSGTGRGENVKVHTLVQLTTNDYIEIWVENDTSSNNILVTELNVIIE